MRDISGPLARGCSARRGSDMRYVTVLVRQVLKKTDLAVLCWIDQEEVWLPLTQIEDGELLEIEEGDDDIELNVALWLAKEKGLVTD
jgi:hypothetical protein